MAALASDSRSSPRNSRGLWMRLVMLGLCLATLAALPGCGGCRKTPEEIQAEKQKKEAERRAKEDERKKKKKPDLETGALVSLPHAWGADDCPYKPAHWTTTNVEAKANNFDIWGDLEMGVVDRRGKPVALPGTPYTSIGSRDVALPKGRLKSLESILYVPAAAPDARSASPRLNAQVRVRITARKGGRGVHEVQYGPRRSIEGRQGAYAMPSYQYHFVVLAQWPQSYKYLEGLDSTKNPWDLSPMGDSSLAYYCVHLMTAEKRTSLPPHALCWTSIAYLLWDDAQLTALWTDQRTALVDWLHWGGQLIISGPDSLDALGNSFLGPYLPATSTATRELTAEDFRPLDERWRLRVAGKLGMRLAPAEPMAGVEFDVHPEAREVPGTGGLLVERRVGRGRIVVSAFDLDNPELTNWPGFDGFFNACLLGRAPRVFDEGGVDTFVPQVRWAEGELGRLDPRGVAKLRYVSRDTSPKRVALRKTSLMSPNPMAGGIEVEPQEPADPPGTEPGAWSNFNPVADSARASLKNAARIEIPERMFVVWVVAVYLLILVPANWIVFRSIGRVEWAWAAAPVIAIAYTVVVIRLAQLDIGFARSLTEVAVVETQPDYARAHVTRYTALYTSLATAYDFRLDDPGAQVQPFPATDDARYDFLPGEGKIKLRYHFGTDVNMWGFHVPSNSTGMVHSEQMVDLGGPIRLEETADGWRLVNETGFTLREAGVVRRTGSGQLEAAWLGTLEADGDAPLRFRPNGGEGPSADRLWAVRRGRSAETAPGSEPGEFNVRGLLDLVEDHAGLRWRALEGNDPRNLGTGDPRELEPGDAMLVGWLDEEVPGLEIRPAAPQSHRAAVVVAHLRYGFGEDPRPDKRPRTQDYKSIGPESISASSE